jgi:large subunit ribosomal protein L25
MSTVSLPVQQRTETGKGPARRLRVKGQAPAILYGKKSESLNLSLDIREFTKLLDEFGGSSLFELAITGTDGNVTTRVALLKERQIRPVDDSLVHVDFQAVVMDEPIEVVVPLHFVGIPVGVDKGGIFQPAVREIRISCLPDRIPSVINVDVSGLDLGHSLHIREMTLPEGITPKQEQGLSLASVLALKKEGEEAAPAEAAPAPAKAAPAAGKKEK